MSAIPFQHKMAAHCESGTVTALLNHAGLPITEPLAFGIAAGIFFGYFHTRMLPFPTFVLRNKPGKIRTNIARRLGVTFRTSTFRHPRKAMAALDELLARGIPVAVQVDFFYMDYIPPYARAHFNAHYVIVAGKQDGKYVISDSYAPGLTTLDAGTVELARFVRGPFAPKGLMFHVERLPEAVDFGEPIRRGIREAAFYMRRIPMASLGIRGIRYFAKKVLEWPAYARDIEHLSHEIMSIHLILEERGTGGGGFRFLYATFLQQAAGILSNPELAEMAKTVMEDGDRWRDISLFVARIGRQRDLGPERLKELSEMILERADAENEIFTRLAAIAR